MQDVGVVDFVKADPREKQEQASKRKQPTGRRVLKNQTKSYCGWTKSTSHHFETMVIHCFLGIYRGIIIPGFLRWCEMDCVHPQNCSEDGHASSLFLSQNSCCRARGTGPTTILQTLRANKTKQTKPNQTKPNKPNQTKPNQTNQTNKQDKTNRQTSKQPPNQENKQPASARV